MIIITVIRRANGPGRVRYSALVPPTPRHHRPFPGFFRYPQTLPDFSPLPESRAGSNGVKVF